MHQAETIGGEGSQQEDWEVQGALLHAEDQLLTCVIIYRRLGNRCEPNDLKHLRRNTKPNILSNVGTEVESWL